MTRAPANPICALGSAMITSPSMAKLAATPPVVGCSRIDRYGSPASRRRPSAAEVLAICISERTPSCMRAPPEAEKISAGTFRSSARSNTRVIFSPATEPIDPPMNSNTKKPSSTGIASIRAEPERRESAPPAVLRAALRRSLYFFESRKLSGSTLSIDPSASTKLPGSTTSSIRRADDSGKWCSHCGQTLSFFSRSAVSRAARQSGHLVKTPTGTLRFSSERSSSRSSLLYQAIVRNRRIH